MSTSVNHRGTYREFKSRLFPAVSTEAALPALPELALLDDINNVDLTRQTFLQEQVVVSETNVDNLDKQMIIIHEQMCTHTSYK